MNWTNLPRQDKNHLRENKIFTKWQFQEQINHIKKVQSEGEHPLFVCHECIRIAQKIGIW